MASSNRKAINFENAEDALLAFLHHEFVTDGDLDFHIDGLSESIPTFSKNVLHVSVDDLVTKTFVIKRTETRKRGSNRLLGSALRAWLSDEYEIDLYRISKPGLRRVQSWSETYYEQMLGHSSAQEHKVDTSDKIPASDRKVTLTDNQVEEATKALDDFVKEFQQDHHFDNEWANEKSVLVEALESGKAYIAKKVIDARIGTLMTIDHLKVVIAKYKDAGVSGTVSALAQKAIDILADIFKNGLG